MLFSFIIGVIAGYAARLCEAVLQHQLTDRYAIGAENTRLLAFVLMLLGAVILLNIGGIIPRPFALILGAGIGVFYEHLFSLAKDEYAKYKNTEQSVTNGAVAKRTNRKAQKPKKVDDN